jgi:hypothetical protein
MLVRVLVSLGVLDYHVLRIIVTAISITVFDKISYIFLVLPCNDNFDFCQFNSYYYYYYHHHHRHHHRLLCANFVIGLWALKLASK